MPSYANLLALIASFTTLASSFELTIRGGGSGRCNGDFKTKDTYGANKGCRTDFAGEGAGILVKSEGEQDDANILVLFSSTDCDPGTIIAYGDQYTDNGDFDVTCIQGEDGETYGSFAVWNVLESRFLKLLLPIASMNKS